MGPYARHSPSVWNPRKHRALNQARRLNADASEHGCLGNRSFNWICGKLMPVANPKDLKDLILI